MCGEFGCPRIDLFTSTASSPLTHITHSRYRDVEERVLFSTSRMTYVSTPFPLFVLLRTGFVESYAFLQSLHGPDSSTLATNGVVCRSSGSSGGRTCQTPHAVEPAGAAPRVKSFTERESLLLHTWKSSSTHLQVRIFQGGCGGCCYRPLQIHIISLLEEMVQMFYVGVVEEIHLHARPLCSILLNSLCIFGRS